MIGGGMGGTGLGISPALLAAAAAQRLANAKTPKQKRDAENLAAHAAGVMFQTPAGRFRPPAEQLEDIRKRARDIQAKEGRAPTAGMRDYFGIPTYRSTAEDMLYAIQLGRANPEVLKDAEQHGGGMAISLAMLDAGAPFLKAIPGLSEVLATLDIVRDIPILGDLVEDILGGALGLVGDITEGVGEVLDEIPGVSQALGAAKKVPIVGDLLDMIF